MPAERCFREEQPIVDRDLEPSTVRRDQSQFANLFLVGCQKFVRQTDGTWRVVSLLAVFDPNPHKTS